jgi:hypothetical protein
MRRIPLIDDEGERLIIAYQRAKEEAAKERAREEERTKNHHYPYPGKIKLPKNSLFIP